MFNYNRTSNNKRIVQVLEKGFHVFVIKLKDASLLCVVLCHRFISYHDKRNCGVTIFIKIEFVFHTI